MSGIRPGEPLDGAHGGAGRSSSPLPGHLAGRSVSPRSADPKSAGLAARIRGGSPDLPPSPPSEEIRVSIRSHSPTPLIGTKIPVPDDGNCLFHSLQWGLEDNPGYLRGHGLQTGRLDQKEIRKEVSHTLQNMLDSDPEGFGSQFFGILLNANDQIQDKLTDIRATRDLLRSEGHDVSSLNNDIRELEGQILDDPSEYAKRVATDRFWGGEAELIGFANRYRINIKIYEQKGDRIEDTGLPIIAPSSESLESLGIRKEEVPTISLIASKLHYEYFRPHS